MFKKRSFAWAFFEVTSFVFPGKYYKEKRSKPLNCIGLKNVKPNSKKIIDENQKILLLKGGVFKIKRRSSETSIC